MASWNKNFRFSGEETSHWIHYFKIRDAKRGNWNRVYKISKEDRVYKIPGENRVYKVPQDIKDPDPNIYIDEEGNEIPLADSPTDKAGVEWASNGGTIEWDEVDGKRENFTVYFDSTSIKNKKEDPNPKEFHQPNIIKGKASLKGEAFLKGTLSVKGKATGEVKPPPENKEPDPFEKKLELWGRILPKKLREEYFGDLLEDRAILEKRGLSKWRVNMVTLGKLLFLLRAAHWEWLQDLVTSIFESIKELIP